MCLRKSILAIWLINGKAFVSVSPSGAYAFPFFFPETSNKRRWPFPRRREKESPAAVANVQPGAGRVMGHLKPSVCVTEIGRRVAVLFSPSNMKDPNLQICII